MKKFSIPCDFNGTKAPFTIYIGEPEPSHHPLNFQADWLSKERGGMIPQEIMDSVAKLKELADKNNVSFEDLCVYALGSAQQSEQEENQESDEYDEEDEEDLDYDILEEALSENEEESEQQDQTGDSTNKNS